VLANLVPNELQEIDKITDDIAEEFETYERDEEMDDEDVLYELYDTFNDDIQEFILNLVDEKIAQRKIKKTNKTDGDENGD
jgi:hypothetical protein